MMNRKYIGITSSSEDSDFSQCSVDPHDPNQDQAWKAVNQTLITVWESVDKATNSLTSFFSSIMKVPMHFIVYAVPHSRCCHLHFSMKENECLAFNTWLLGRMLFILGREKLKGVHEAALDAQSQILNLLLATHPPLHMHIIVHYLQSMQDLISVMKRKDNHFPILLQRFVPMLETIRNLELDLKPCHLKLQNLTECHYVLLYILRVLQITARGVVGLKVDEQLEVWRDVCFLIEEAPPKIQAAAVKLAACLVEVEGPPPLQGNGVCQWRRLWSLVQALVKSPAMDQDEEDDVKEMSASLHALFSAASHRLYKVGPLEEEVLQSSVFSLMQSQLNPRYSGDVQNSISKLTALLLDRSAEWRLDVFSLPKIMDNFKEGNKHVLPGLKLLIFHELELRVPCLQKLYDLNAVQASRPVQYMKLLNQSPAPSLISVLDVSPAWRELWMCVNRAADNMSREFVAAACVLEEIQICNGIIELAHEIVADLQNLLLKGSDLVCAQFIFLGDSCLSQLLSALVSAVHQCRPSQCTDAAITVLEATVGLLGRLLSLPEVQDRVEDAEALLSLPWLDPGPASLDLDEDHLVFKVQNEFRPYLNISLKKLCLFSLSQVCSVKHLKWHQEIMERCLETRDLRAAALEALPWLLFRSSHPLPHADVMALLSPWLEDTDPEVQLAVAQNLSAIVCSLSGKTVLVREAGSGVVKSRLLCVLCQQEDWESASFPYGDSLEVLLKCVEPLLKSGQVEVRRCIASALPTLSGHLLAFRQSLSLDSWTPLLLDEDREVRVQFAKHSRWLVFNGNWVKDKEQVSKETGDEYIPLTQQDRRELRRSEPLLANFLKTLIAAIRQSMRKQADPKQESLVLTVCNIGCIPLDCVLLPSLIQLLALAGHWRSSHACQGLVKKSIADIAHAHNVTAKDLFSRFKPELCKTIIHTAVRYPGTPGGSGFVNTLTLLGRLFDYETATEFLTREGETVIPPLVAMVMARPSPAAVLKQVAILAHTTLKDLLQASFQHIYPYIVVNESDEILTNFLEFLKKECEVDDLDALIARSLKIIHNELLLHFKGHRKRVLECLQGLARIDPLYQCVNNPLSEEQIADFLECRFLGVLTHLEMCLTSNTAAETVKVKALRSIPELIRLMGPRHISMMRFKVLATLRIALSLNHAHFPHLTIAAWEAFVHSLDDQALGPLLSSVFASLIPLLETYPEEVASLFRYVVIQKQEDLGQYFKELYFVPDHSAVQDVVAQIRHYSPSASKSTLYDTLREKLTYVRHDNMDVRLYALQYLTEVLSKSRSELNEAFVKQDKVDPVIIDMLHKLTEACRDSDERVKMAAGECLGKIGAIDPGILPHRKCLGGSGFFAKAVDNDAFAVQALNLLAKGFQDATDMRTVDSFSLSIQELLKVYRVCSDGPLWGSFPRNVQDIMRPLLNTSYKSKYKLPVSFPTPIYGSKLGSNMQDWMMNWSSKLVMGMVEGCPRDVFQSCMLAFRKDTNTALFFLPYMLLHALIDARNPGQMQDEVVKELQALLESPDLLSSPPAASSKTDSASTSFSEPLNPRFRVALEEPLMLSIHERAAAAAALLNSLGPCGPANVSEVMGPELHNVDLADRERCSRIAFQLVDFLWHWLRTVQPPSKEERLSNDNPVSTVQGFLKRLCKLQIAQRCFECQEYARALVYLEQYIRENKQNPSELQNQLWFFEELYVHLDDPDAVAGTLAIQGHEPSLKQLARAHEVTGQFQNAAACYEQMAQAERLEPEQIQGMIRCYLSLEQPFTSLKIIEGVVSDRPELAQDIHEQYAESLWRLHHFTPLEELVESPALANNTSWGVQVGRSLLLLRQAQHKEVASVLESTLRAVVDQLASMDRQHGVYYHGYDHIVKLHILYELKKASEMLSSVLGCEESGSSVCSLLDEWRERISVVKKAAGSLEPILCLRRIVLEQACTVLQRSDPESASRLNAEIGNSWLRSAKTARKEGYHQQAYIYILNAEKYKPPALFIEKARLYWEKGDQESAFNTLKRGLEEQFPDAARFEEMTDRREERLLCAKARLLIAQYNDELVKVDTEQSVQQYKAAMHACQQWERSLVLLARFYDRLFQNMPDETKDTLGADMQVAMVTYLGRSLQHGTKYIYQSMPRMLTLWLDYGSHGSSEQQRMCEARNRAEFSSSTSSSTDTESTILKLTDLIRTYTETLPPYLFYTAFSQLVSRVCHQNKVVVEQLKAIILKIVLAYPQQALWMFMGSLKSGYDVRAKRCKEILQLPEIRRAHLAPLVSHYNMLTDQLIELTNAPVNRDKITISDLAPKLPQLLSSANFSEVIIPVDQFLNFVLPTSGVATRHVAFPQRLVFIRSVLEEVQVLQSLQKPRRITLIGSDGNPYPIMCKPKDDLRKDFRLMEFDSVVNRLLRRDPQARQRELRIRTYTVVPLNEECGAVEWLSHLVGLRPLLLKMYRAMGISVSTRIMKEVMATKTDPMPKRRENFQRLLDMHPPILSEWFLATFPDAASWYLARTSYVRTAAVMSMVGYVLGLGDRHGENILLDQRTGEAVHVDFNCLFNKGDNFDWPEVVPFRLTQNMVDAMGPLGIEGSFRRTCEVTLRVLRAQSDTLMSVLRPFLYDPIISWKRHQGRRQSSPVEMTNEMAVQNLSRIERRLQGVVRGANKSYAIPLSVEGQANSLILEAMSIDNLCRMYVGWGAYL